MRIRSIAGLLLPAMLVSCGFHPLYGTQGAHTAQLASIFVEIVPNRAGQLLRQALQARLEGDTTGIARQFTLAIAYGESSQGIAIQSDNSTTRARDVGTVAWSLHAVDNASVQIAGGTVRAVDGYNIIDEQFFYADLSEDATERRLADALADQIVTGLAVYFDRHPGRG